MAPVNKYLYNGKELNDEEGVGLYDYGARWYDAAYGRFVGVDPIAEEFPWVNGFNYAENEPVANVDLHGLQKVRAANEFLSRLEGVSNATAQKLEAGKAYINEKY
ncbi:RHS repeat-associated core domain-containing protein, partial [Arthrospira platensis SPKY1]|nr:RHS repeat-associated core domain-containing protein [Arthrospira platensis SPKY1]